MPAYLATVHVAWPLPAQVANSGYLESVRSLRETLLVQEWGLTAKTWAQKR